MTDGTGALLLLDRAGYEVGRYVSLERVIEQSKETYYEALYRSSQGWHEGRHDLRPWLDYFLGTLIAACKEFEERVGTISSARGAKRELVRGAVARPPQRFTIGELAHACSGISRRTLVRALQGAARHCRLWPRCKHGAKARRLEMPVIPRFQGNCAAG